MRTPLFQQNQKLFADTPSELTDIEANVLNIFRNEMSGASALYAHQRDTPVMAVFVEPARHLVVDGISLQFAGGASPTFTAPVSGTRVDLLTLTSAGVLTIHQNVVSFGNYPANEMPICEVYLTSTTTSILDSAITDVRPMLGASANPFEKQISILLGTDAIDYPTNKTFAITTGTYLVATGALDVFVDGVRKELGTSQDYTELTNTTIKFNEKIDDTQSVVIVVNSGSAISLNNKVSKTGDSMSGTLQLPKLELGSTNFYIDYSGNDLRFRDINNPTPRTLSQLYTNFASLVSSMVPDTTATYNIGSLTKKWLNGYFSGNVSSVSGVDTATLQLTPQLSEPGAYSVNKVWIDSNTGKVTWKDSGGTVRKIIDDAGAILQDFYVGRTFDENIRILFKRLTGSAPFLKYDNTSSKLKYSHNGVDEYTMGFNISQDIQVVSGSVKTVFTLPFSYEAGTNKLSVYINGVLQTITTDYVETDSTTVTFQFDVQIADTVIFKYFY